jgi:glycosyltransferase involved in cell wall biosynthesis
VKPVLFVTNHVPPDRRGAFRALHERVGIELALFGGRSHHATAGVADPGVPHRHVGQREAHALAASGNYRAVICGTAGRAALPAAWRGARRARVPFLLWSALWHHPRTPAHVLAGAPLLRAIYRDADAVVTYGPHVSDFARARGAHNVHVAPQAVNREYWETGEADRRRRPYTVLFVGREAPYKGVGVLLDAWRASGLEQARAALVLVGIDRGSTGAHSAGSVIFAGACPPEKVRNFMREAHVAVMPAIFTRSYREPWGLVANEAMHQGLPVIASTAVGAAAGGLVRHERNGLVVPAGDSAELARAMSRLRDDPGLRDRLSAAARRDVAAFTYGAWAAGFESALDSIEPKGSLA